MSLEENVRSWVRGRLKLLKISYKIIAKRMGVSESQVKRLLTDQKIDLDTFSKFCLCIGVSPAEALLNATNNPDDLAELSLRQDQFLFDNPRIDYLFLRLFIGYPVKEIAEDIGMSANELQQSLLKLERHDLIAIKKSGSVTVRKRGPFTWNPKGPTHLGYTKIFFRKACRHLESLLFSNEKRILSRAFELYLSDANYQQMLLELEDLINKYKKRSRLDQVTTKASDLHPVCTVIGMSKFNTWRSVLLDAKPLPEGTELPSHR